MDRDLYLSFRRINANQIVFSSSSFTFSQVEKEGIQR